MVKEILKIRDYVDVKWRYWAIGAVFMVLNALFNGISIFSIVPLMDNIIAGKEIRLPEKLPAFASVRLEAYRECSECASAVSRLEICYCIYCVCYGAQRCLFLSLPLLF